MIAIVKKVHFQRKTDGRKRLADGPKPVPPPRIPRVSRLMALAIRFQGLLRDGTVWDQSDLARLAHVTQPRMTQILNLNHLAPDIQDDLLFLPPVEGRDPIHERMLRPLTAMLDWGKQRAAWRAISGKRIANGAGASTSRLPQK
jgi:hypothetical protein